MFSRNYYVLTGTVFGLVVVLCWLCLPCRMAGAQTAPAAPAPGYVVDPIDKAQSKNRSKMTQILRSATLTPADQAALDAYYRDYDLAQWSQPGNITEIPGYRATLSGRTLRSARSQVGHDYLVQFVLDYMSAHAKGNYHPTVRFNAMLMIGLLNEREPEPTSLPVPLPLALQQELLPALTAQDPAQTDAIRLAALIGILRHARLGGITDAAVRGSVTTEVVRLLQSTSPPGRSADGHGWMRARAAEVLGELKQVGANGAVAKALAAVAGERTAPMRTRCAAAAALGKLNYAGAAGLNASQLAGPVGQLAVDACAAELKAVSRRRLKSRIHAASFGLTGIGVLATGPPHQAFVAKLKAPIDAILLQIEDRATKDNEMVNQMKQEAIKLRAAVSGSS